MRYHVGACAAKGGKPAEAVIRFDSKDLDARREALEFARRLHEHLRQDHRVRVEFYPEPGLGRYRVTATRFATVEERVADGVLNYIARKKQNEG